MHFHEAFARALSDQGITDIFGIIGDGNLFIIDSFERVGGGRFHSVSHEGSGVLAAIGYARTTGRVGVATVTHGPALTNTATALVEGTRGRLPVVLIAGDTAVIDRDNLQNIAQREFVVSTGAGFEQVRAPENVADDLATATRRAWIERRPIVLNVPADFQWAETEYAPNALPAFQPSRVSPAPDSVEEAVGAIASARRPVVVAGLGAIDPEAKDAVLRLAARIGAPVATTLQAQGLFAGHPHDLAVFGVSSTAAAVEVVLSADAVIAFGASLNQFTTAEGSLLSGKTVVQVDSDPAAFYRYSEVDVAVLGDSGATADALVSLLDDAEVPATSFADAALAERLASWPPEPHRDESSNGTIDIRTAMARIEQAVPRDRTLVTDVGRFMLHAFEHFHAPEPRAFVSTVAFGSVGLGMANAIGAGVGRPGHPVLLTTGDGGFAMGGIAELLPALRHRIDLIVVLFNDGAYGAEHIQFAQRGLDPKISTFDWPDLGPLATAMGAQGFTVRTLDELDDALAAIETRDRTIFIDVRIDPFKVEGLGH